MDVNRFFVTNNYHGLKLSNIDKLGNKFIYDCKRYLLLNIAEHLSWKINCCENIELFGIFTPYTYCHTIEITDRTLIDYRYKTLKGKFINLFDRCSDYFKSYFKYEIVCIYNSEKKFVITINENLIKNNKQINNKEVPLITPFNFGINLFYTGYEGMKLLEELLNKLYEQIDFNYQKSYLWENDNEIKSAYRGRLYK